MDGYLKELSYQTSYKVNQRMNTDLNALENLRDQLRIVTENQKPGIIDNAIGYIDDKGVFSNNCGCIELYNTC